MQYENDDKSVSYNNNNTTSNNDYNFLLFSNSLINFQSFMSQFIKET